jgi:lysozyme
MNDSPIGRALIERNEGLQLTTYYDVVGIPTIGYGDTGPDVVPGLTITKEEADQRLSRRLAREFEPKVMARIGNAPTTQNQFDAMVSLAYNIGPGRIEHQRGIGGFDGSSVAREHVAGNYAAAANDFLLWNKAGGVTLNGLTRRRAEERALYLGAPATVATDHSGSTTRRVLRLTAPPMDGYDVREVVMLLKAAGVGPPLTSMVYDADVADAVGAFQQAKGLVDDGEVGPRTWAALLAVKGLPA